MKFQTGYVGIKDKVFCGDCQKEIEEGYWESVKTRYFKKVNNKIILSESWTKKYSIFCKKCEKKRQDILPQIFFFKANNNYCWKRSKF